jgi:hypothetical protein
VDDFPAGVPHVAVDRGATPAVFVGARREAAVRESQVMRPELGALVPHGAGPALPGRKGAAMAQNKTKPTEMSVESYFLGIEDEARRKDCEALARLMSKATKQKPKMWGTSIVGFGSYHYKYESGREGDMCLVGFSSRKGDISVYGATGAAGHEALLAKLGKHKMGKGCLYLRKLSDVDPGVLEQLITGSVAQKKRLHGQGGHGAC